MRTMVAALAATALMACAAQAQYKTPAATPAAPAQAPAAAQAPVAVSVPSQPAVDPNAEAKRIPRAEAIRMVKEHKAVWIDVRSKEQYELGHIPGAINIPLAELQNRWKDLPSRKFLIAYCA